MKTNNHYLIQKVVIYFCEKLVKLNLLFTSDHGFSTGTDFLKHLMFNIDGINGRQFDLLPGFDHCSRDLR